MCCPLTCRTAEQSECGRHEAEKQLHSERHWTYCRHYTLSGQSDGFAGEICATTHQHGYLLHDKGELLPLIYFMLVSTPTTPIFSAFWQFFHLSISSVAILGQQGLQLGLALISL